MNIFTYIKEEIIVIKKRDPAIKRTSEVFLYPSFHAILRYRAAHWVFVREHYFVARWISQTATRRTGIEIHPGAVIGQGLFIDHGYGVVIGETAIIGDNVTLYQGVTLGGTGKEHGKRHPTIGDNVMISAGAKILGSFTVGENSKIGAGSVVLSEVPPNSTVVGIPGRVIKRNDEKVIHPQDTLDQIHFPDPIRHEICRLQMRVQDLERATGKVSKEELEALEYERCALCPDRPEYEI
jgi:serine O-acetyltransferase